MEWYFKALKKYADFSGRAQRAEYWYFVLFNTIIVIILTILDGVLGLYDMRSGFGVLSGIYQLAVFIPSLAVSVRRLHDIGKSGWWLLVGLIPIVGFIILIVWFATDSKEDNKYGQNPKGRMKKAISDDDLEQLEKLAKLKEKGIITQQEFEAKKREILNRV